MRVREKGLEVKYGTVSDGGGSWLAVGGSGKGELLGAGGGG